MLDSPAELTAPALPAPLEPAVSAGSGTQTCFVLPKQIGFDHDNSFSISRELLRTCGTTGKRRTSTPMNVL